MALRTPKIACAGSLALVVAAVLLLAGPLSEAAEASACSRYGKDMPRQLSKREGRMAVRCLLNRKRENHGLRPLAKSARLKKAAQRHNNYMQDHNCFAHECPGEPSVLSRLKRAKYITGGLRSWAYGENIAWGGSHLGCPKALVRAWMHSPGHRHNILNPDFREIGIGFSRGTVPNPGSGGSTVTTDFGMREG